MSRFGDLFPLPLPLDEGYVGELDDLGSRRARQRVHRRRTLVERERGTSWALNSLAGFADSSAWPSAPLNSAQLKALQHVRCARRARPPPLDNDSAQAALRQLLCKKAGTSYSGDQPGQLTSYDRSRLSLPRGQKNPAILANLLPPAERHRLDHFEEEMLLSSEEAGAVLEVGLEGECYMDPALAHDNTKYHEFISDLIDCNLLYFTDTPRVQVGAFVVTKKQQRQRLIIDARRANLLSGLLHLLAWVRSSPGQDWKLTRVLLFSLPRKMLKTTSTDWVLTSGWASISVCHLSIQHCSDRYVGIFRRSSIS